MSEMKHENEKMQSSGFRLVIPFLVVLGLLSVVSFIIPLRPTVSYSEKRELAKFPEFSWSALVSGDYFDDITLWFSDTFPGREEWMILSDYTASLHGYSEIAIEQDDFMADIMFPEEEMSATEPEIPSTEATEPAAGNTDPVSTGDEEPVETQETVAETQPEGWGGVDAGDDAEIALGGVIQIGDTAFNQLGFSQYASDRYSRAISTLADLLADTDVRVISAPAPTSVGIMIEAEYLEKLNCARQDEMLSYLHDNMSGNVIKVDTFTPLVTRNDEYIYFRTDHHWTALGAYYTYVAICETLGMEAAPLESFEEWDQGEFRGSLSGKARWNYRLKTDTVTAYIPEGDITMYVHNNYGDPTQMPLLQDMTQRNIYEKYLCFIGGDHALAEIVNDSLPDGPSCVVIKDSFGNCFVPFLTQNYHKVYVMDYRKYTAMTLSQFVEEYGIDDVICIPYMMATQSYDGAGYFERLCK